MMAALKFWPLVVVLCGVCICDAVKRSDDISPLEALVSRLASSFKTLEAKFAALTSTVDILREGVGFSVTVSHESSQKQDVMVKFDKVLYNQGKGYVPSSGFFIAPVSGMYCVFIKTETFPHKGSGFEVFKEGEKILRIYGPPQSMQLTPSDAAVTHLDRGQRLWVNTCCVDGLVRTSTHFGGFLVQADTD